MKGSVGSPTEEMPGPLTVMRYAPMDRANAAMLQAQANTAKTPEEAQRYALLAALEKKFAMQNQVAQQGVQDAYLAPGADIIYGSPQQTMALMQRSVLRQKARQDYNRDLQAVGTPRAPFTMPPHKDPSLDPTW